MKKKQSSNHRALILSFVFVTAIILALLCINIFALIKNEQAVETVLRNYQLIGSVQQAINNLGKANEIFGLLQNDTVELSKVETELASIEDEFSTILIAIQSMELSDQEREMAIDFVEDCDRVYSSFPEAIKLRRQIMTYMTEYKGEVRSLFDVLTERQLQHMMYVQAIKKSAEIGQILVSTFDYRECGFFIWYSQENHLRDTDIAEVIYDDIHPLHRKLHEYAAIVAENIRNNTLEQNKLLLADAENDLEQLGRYLTGTRALIKTRHDALKAEFNILWTSLTFASNHAKTTAEKLESYIYRSSLNPSLTKLTATNTLIIRGIFFFAILGIIVSVLIAISSFKRVSQQTKRLEAEVEERKRISEDLQEKGNFLRVVIDSLNHPFSVIDSKTYEIQLANKAALQGAGVGENKYCYQVNHNRTTPCSGGNHACPLQSVLESGESHVVEHIHKGENGRDRNVEVQAYPIRDSNGDINAIIEYCIDITERKEAELELIQTRSLAEKASRVKTDFLANMSHEIRTPMNAIKGFVDLILQMKISDEQKQYLLLVQHSTNNLLSIINDILDLSKIEAGKLDIDDVSFDITALIDETIHFHLVTAKEKGLQLAYHFQPNTPTRLYGDSGRLQQVLNNLISNAIKFTPWGGVEIDITAKPISGAENDDTPEWQFHFSIMDTGIGVTRERQEKIFQAFTQEDSSTTRKFGGTGLGLTISNKLVELMHGKIWLESRADQGTIFHFTVPFALDREMTETRKGKGSPNNHPPIPISLFKNVHILIADDEPINQIMFTAILNQQDCNITCVADGKQVVEAITNKTYDLILMDIQMPEMDGTEATRQIRAMEKKHTDHIPIIALTAHAMKGDRERYLNAGMDAYITKPIDAAELISTIAELLQLSQDKRES